MATRGSSFASQSSFSTGFSTTSQAAPQSKPKANDEFGVFQSSDNDAWSMGQGIGECSYPIIIIIVNLGNLTKKPENPKTQAKMGIYDKQREM